MEDLPTGLNFYEPLDDVDQDYHITWINRIMIREKMREDELKKSQPKLQRKKAIRKGVVQQAEVKDRQEEKKEMEHYMKLHLSAQAMHLDPSLNPIDLFDKLKKYSLYEDLLNAQNEQTL